MHGIRYRYMHRYKERINQIILVSFYALLDVYRPSRQGARPTDRPGHSRGEASWARTTPPLFDFPLYMYRGHQSRAEPLIHGNSSRLYFLLEHAYSSVILHIFGYDVNSCTQNKFRRSQLCTRVMHFSTPHSLSAGRAVVQGVDPV